MFEELEKINERPEPFQYYTASDLWTDEHTSTSLIYYGQQIYRILTNHASWPTLGEFVRPCQRFTRQPTFRRSMPRLRLFYLHAYQPG